MTNANNSDQRLSEFLQEFDVNEDIADTEPDQQQTGNGSFGNRAGGWCSTVVVLCTPYIHSGAFIFFCCQTSYEFFFLAVSP